MPTCTWSVDTFGHSAAASGLFDALGYSNQVLNRIPYDLKMLFQGSGNSFFSKFINYIHGESTSLRNNVFHYFPSHVNTRFHFNSRDGTKKRELHQSYLATTVLPEHYNVPCKAISYCSYLYDMALPDDDIKAIANELLIHVRRQAPRVVLLPSPHIDNTRFTSHGHLLLLLGDDFSARNADIMYRNIDLIVSEFNSMQQHENDYSKHSYVFNAKYSTPKTFFDVYSSVLIRKNTTTAENTARLPQNRSKRTSNRKHMQHKPKRLAGSGDFLPYSDNIVNDWTGYYGSRPTLKHEIRYCELLCTISIE